MLNCKWVYIYKFDKYGHFIKVKVRLIVRGDEQLKSFTESNYTATLAERLFRILIAIADHFNLELLQYDAVKCLLMQKLKKMYL